MNFEVNDYTITVLESVFASVSEPDFNQVFEAAVFLYNYVVAEKSYPGHIVDAFYSAMVILSDLTMRQFLQIRQIFA